MENHKPYKVELYERGRQYNGIVMYSIAQARGYNSSLPLDFFSYRKRYA